MANKISLILPVDSAFVITQGFGENPEFYQNYPEWKTKSHNGLDFGTPEDSLTWATAKGDIYKVGYEEKGFGNYVYILHEFGITVHAHLKEYFVTVGQHVDQGQGIGYTGNTGVSFGAHLHYGLRTGPLDNGWNGYVDPTPYFVGNENKVPTEETTVSVGQKIKVITEYGANIRDAEYNKIGYKPMGTELEIIGKPIIMHGLEYYPVKYAYIAKKDGYGNVIFE